MLDQIKTQDGWVAGVIFLCKRKGKKAHMSKEESPSKRKDIKELYIKLSHPLEAIMRATEKAI